jgi:glycine/D-amino acid oxidase-like deaminating enzyme
VATPKTADAVVIGGGIIGVSVAYYLAQRDFGRIIMLEREALGSGSTGRSVASIDLFSLQPAALELQFQAYEIFAHFEELIGAECGLVTTGFAALGGPEHTADLQKAVAATIAAGIETQLITPADFAALEPAANTEDLATICYVPAAGYADPVLTLNAYAAAARRAGVVIQQGKPVTGLAHQGGRVTGVKTMSEVIAAPVVVCAAGPWNGRLLKSFGVDDLGLYTVRHPVIVMQGSEDHDLPRLSILDLPNDTYARPETGGLTLAGSITPAVGYDPVEPEDNDQGVTAEYTYWAAERLVQRYPSLASGRLRPGWSGLMTISPDWQPVLGAIPELPGLYCAAGFSGQGFKIGPAVGNLMAGLLAGESEAIQLLAPFRPTRFVENQPLTTSGVVALG